MEKRKISASLRAAAIATLTLQNGAQALLVRYSKEARRPGAPPYLGSSVVLVCECVKLLSAAAMLKARARARRRRRRALTAHAPPQHHQSGDGRAAWLWRGGAWRSSLLFAPPAAVYAVQNNLLLVAARALDPPTFLLLSQFKILTTASFSLALMGRRLHRVRWCALLLLVVGVGLVQDSHAAPRRLSPAERDAAEPAALSEFTLGVCAALAMSTLSGFAAVYTESALKRLRLPTQQCNVYMAAYGALFSALAAGANDGRRIAAAGFFQGWNGVTVGVVAISAAGGLLVAFFLRYLDAILKNFAATAAIVLSTAAAIPMFGFQPTLEWALGATVVVVAIMLYSEGDVSDPPPLASPPLRLLAGSALEQQQPRAGAPGGQMV